MKKHGAVGPLVASLLIVPLLFGLDPLLAENPTQPPTNLKKVGDHWTAWDPPEPGPDAYIIQKGDTLWDLAGKWLGDPFLWPQVWDENRYILDSHWIYPGDPLVIPGQPTVVPEKGPPPITLIPEDKPTEPPVAQRQPEPPPLLPVADASDVYCSGHIEPEHATSELWVAGNEQEKTRTAQGDVIYLNHGRDWGIDAGDAFAIVRPTLQVSHPVTEQPLGSYVRRLGKVRVLLAHQNTSTAVIEMSCEDILPRDELLPWDEIEIPLMESLPAFKRYDVTPSGGPGGAVVFTSPQAELAAEGNIIHTDLGAASGVRPGDVLTLFREQGDLPRLNLGQAVILTVEPGTSTAKITRSVREMGVGDRVEVVR